MMKLVRAALLLVAAIGSQVSAQTWDTSGNSLLNGTYYFREVIWVVGDSAGNFSDVLALYGNITFNGNGGYTISNTQVLDGSAGTIRPLSTSGTYSVSASGLGFLSHPVLTGESVYGLVSRGILIGGSTENSQGFNDLFIAAPLASPLPTNSAFQGSYSMMAFDSPSGSPLDTRESQFQLNPDGNGNIGTVRATGYIAAGGSTLITQNFSGVRYFFSNGGANVSFGGSLTGTNLLAGTKYLYLSADGSFVFGGSPTAWDMIVGVRNGGAAPNFSGLYYQAGMYQDESQLANGFADLDNFYGSFKALGGGLLLGHQRLLSPFNNNALDFTYSGNYALKADGTYDDGSYHYVFGSGGALRIGLGTPPTLGINVAVQAPSFTPSGVFIDPTGILNAASSALFTSGIAPGEFISIYGANLASTTQVATTTFPSTLGGVQVMVNNRPAPIYYVSPALIEAVVPFATSEVVANVQVISNNVASNTVSSFVNLTSPGIFTKPEGGLGNAAALHADFSVVTTASPARAGETIAVFVTGLGDVSPAVADGAPGPTDPLSLATNTFSVFIGGQRATTTFIGLAPQLIGLYQINLTVPSGVAVGNATMTILGPDSFNVEASIPIGSSSTAAPIESTAAEQRSIFRAVSPRRLRSPQQPVRPRP